MKLLTKVINIEEINRTRVSNLMAEFINEVEGRNLISHSLFNWAGGAGVSDQGAGPDDQREPSGAGAGGGGSSAGGCAGAVAEHAGQAHNAIMAHRHAVAREAEEHERIERQEHGREIRRLREEIRQRDEVNIGALNSVDPRVDGFAAAGS